MIWRRCSANAPIHDNDDGDDDDDDNDNDNEDDNDNDNDNEDSGQLRRVALALQKDLAVLSDARTSGCWCCRACRSRGLLRGARA